VCRAIGVRKRIKIVLRARSADVPNPVLRGRVVGRRIRAVAMFWTSTVAVVWHFLIPPFWIRHNFIIFPESMQGGISKMSNIKFIMPYQVQNIKSKVMFDLKLNL